MIPGVTVKRELDESSGRIATVVIEAQGGPQPADRGAERKGQAARGLLDSGRRADRGSARVTSSPPGALLAKTPRQASKTKDITGGLPRVAELFEARRRRMPPRWPASTASCPSRAPSRGKRKLVVKNEETQQEEEHLIPTGKHIIVQPGDVVHKGQHLTEGAADPHEILEILGPSALYDFLISQVQRSIACRA